LLYSASGGQNQGFNLHVVKGENCRSSSQLPWLVAQSVYYLGYRLNAFPLFSFGGTISAL